MRVVIGFPHAATLDAEFVRCLLKTLNENTDDHEVAIVGCIMQPAPAGMVHVARNHIVRKFLATDAEWLWWLNTDKVWEPDAFYQLAESAVGLKVLVLNAHVRNPPADGETDSTPVLFNDDLRPFEPPPGLMLFPVFCAGMGFMLTHRSVFERILEVQGDGPTPWFAYETWEGRDGSSVVGEDFAFCRRLKAAGFTVWVDNAVNVGHRKMVTLRKP